MSILLKADKIGTNGHWHVLFLDDRGQGRTSSDKNHYHNAYVADAEGGRVTVDEVDGHTHTVSDIEVADDLPNDEESKKVSEALRLYQMAYNIEYESNDKASKAEEFYRGKQWKDDIKKTLESTSRAALTINEIEPKLDVLSGYERQNRMQINYRPVEGGDQTTADILNIVVKNILYRNDFEVEEDDVAEDQKVRGRGIFNTYIDEDSSVNPEIRIERFPSEDIVFGPHKARNLRDLEYFIKRPWYSKAKIKQLYPEKKNEVDSMVSMFSNDKDEFYKHLRVRGMQYDVSSNSEPIDLFSGGEMIDIESKNIRLLELWRKQYSRVSLITEAVGSLAEQFPVTIGKKAKTIPGLVVKNVNQARYRVTVVAGMVLLDDYMSDMIVWPIVPVYAKKRGSHFWGKVIGAVDAQQQANKSYSQYMDILNKVAAYGWFIDGDLFETPKDERDFIENSSKPGFVSRLKDVNRQPSMVEGVKMPTEITNGLIISSDTIARILNIGPAMQGLDNGQESGIALVEKRQSGLVGNEYLFSNMSLAKRQLGRLIVHLIQDNYSADRIARIVINQATSRGQDMAGITNPQTGEVVGAGEYTYDDIVALIENKDLTQYDVVVDEKPWTSTMRRASFYEFSQLAQHGYQVPPNLLLDLSDMPKKLVDEVKAMNAAMQQQQQGIEEAKINAEIQKTMISAQSKASSMQGDSQVGA